jgi:dTDP-4-dehydrorhamnose reductase
MRILVTGASGLLGLNLCLVKTEGNAVFGIAHNTRLVNVPFTLINQDLTKDKAIVEILERLHPELVVNCAAMANVDLCEQQPERAQVINAQVPGKFARICFERDIPLVHISTDAVFDGDKGNYSETDETNPLSTYARTKLEGERRVLEYNRNALITRVNFFGFSITGKRSLAEFFLNNLSVGKRVRGFNDIFFSPLYVKDLVEILFNLVEKKLTGIVHLVSRDFLSKYDFGVLIGKRFNLDTSLISPVSYKEAELIARRSPNLVLNTSNLRSIGIDIPDVASGIEHFYMDHKDGFPGRIQSFVMS